MTPTVSKFYTVSYIDAGHTRSKFHSRFLMNESKNTHSVVGSGSSIQEKWINIWQKEPAGNFFAGSRCIRWSCCLGIPTTSGSGCHNTTAQQRAFNKLNKRKPTVYGQLRGSFGLLDLLKTYVILNKVDFRFLGSQKCSYMCLFPFKEKKHRCTTTLPYIIHKYSSLRQRSSEILSMPLSFFLLLEQWSVICVFPATYGGCQQKWPRKDKPQLIRDPFIYILAVVEVSFTEQRIFRLCGPHKNSYF